MEVESMSDLLRMTGMYSGMDTETIVTQLVSAKAQRVTTLKNEQKKLEWKPIVHKSTKGLSDIKS